MAGFRLRPQFSLRSLLIVVTLLAVALGGGLAWWQRILCHEQLLMEELVEARRHSVGRGSKRKRIANLSALSAIAVRPPGVTCLLSRAIGKNTRTIAILPAGTYGMG